MEAFDQSNIAKQLIAAGRNDLVIALKDKNGWQSVNEAKVVYTDVIRKKKGMSLDDALTIVDMEFFPIMEYHGVIPHSVKNARDILTMIKDSVTVKKNVKLIQKVIRMTDENCTDMDVIEGMDAVIKIAELGEPYSRIVSECGSYIIESMTIMDESIDVATQVGEIQNINV